MGEDIEDMFDNAEEGDEIQHKRMGLDRRLQDDEMFIKWNHPQKPLMNLSGRWVLDIDNKRIQMHDHDADNYYICHFKTIDKCVIKFGGELIEIEDLTSLEEYSE